MTIDKTLNRVRLEKRTILTEIEAKNLLKETGIVCTDTILAKNKEDAVLLSEKIGYPVVLKVSSIDISHKSDAGGVKLNLRDANEVRKAFDNIYSAAVANYPSANIEGISVQRMADPGIEVIIGMTLDESFGPVLMFGLGGVFVEVLKDVSFRIVPIDKEDAADMINEIQGKKLLEGYRGHPPADVPCLEQILLKLSGFIENTPGIQEIDMNPVFAYKNGAVVADARIILKQ